MLDGKSKGKGNTVEEDDDDNNILSGISQVKSEKGKMYTDFTTIS